MSNLTKLTQIQELVRDRRSGDWTESEVGKIVEILKLENGVDADLDDHEERLDAVRDVIVCDVATEMFDIVSTVDEAIGDWNLEAQNDDWNLYNICLIAESWVLNWLEQEIKTSVKFYGGTAVCSYQQLEELEEHFSKFSFDGDFDFLKCEVNDTCDKIKTVSITYTDYYCHSTDDFDEYFIDEQKAIAALDAKEAELTEQCQSALEQF